MKKIIAANWKLNKSPSQARTFFSSFTSAPSKEVTTVFFPSAVCLETVSVIAKEKQFQFGMQNVYFQGSGAYTGENSAAVLKELGGQFVLVGHSERRSLFGETDDLVQKKAQHIQSLGLTPMICIGETLEERENKKTYRVLESQIEIGLANLTSQVVIAYEPVWAIGTGRVATEEQVADAHQFIYEQLVKRGCQDTPILYGGSVKADNSKDLIQLPNVSGFLVGGASLEPQSFQSIIHSTISI